MREQRVSSVLLVEGGHLYGLVTDRDLRNRAVAEGLDTTRPVIDIAAEETSLSREELERLLDPKRLTGQSPL